MYNNRNRSNDPTAGAFGLNFKSLGSDFLSASSSPRSSVDVPLGHGGQLSGGRAGGGDAYGAGFGEGIDLSFSTPSRGNVPPDLNFMTSPGQSLGGFPYNRHGGQGPRSPLAPIRAGPPPRYGEAFGQGRGGSSGGLGAHAAAATGPWTSGHYGYGGGSGGGGGGGGGGFHQQRSPLRIPGYSGGYGTGFGNQPGSPMGSGMHYNVYDMKSLSAALATVQAGTGAINRIFSCCSFRPRLPGLTKLVSQLTREGNWQKGLEVFEALPVLGVVADTTITNAAISSCDKGGQWEKAIQIFNSMDSVGLPRDAITYSAVISALSKGRQWALAIDVFNHMSDAGIECDAVTCCSLITALDKGGQWQLAEQVFMQMYADHPQFRMLLQCMEQQNAAEGNTPGTPTSAAATPATLGVRSDVTPGSTPGGGWGTSVPLSSSIGMTSDLLSPDTPLHVSGGVAGISPASAGFSQPGLEAAVLGALKGDTASMATLNRLYRSVSAFPRIDENEALGSEADISQGSRLAGCASGASSIRRQLFSEQSAAATSGGGGSSGGGTAATSSGASTPTAGDACPPQTPTSKAPGLSRFNRAPGGTDGTALSSGHTSPHPDSVVEGSLSSGRDSGTGDATAPPGDAVKHGSSATSSIDSGVKLLMKEAAGGTEGVAGGGSAVEKKETVFKPIDPQISEPEQELSRLMQQLSGLPGGGVTADGSGSGGNAAHPSIQTLHELLMLPGAGAVSADQHGNAAGLDPKADLLSGIMRQISGMPGVDAAGLLETAGLSTAGLSGDWESQLAAAVHQQLASQFGLGGSGAGGGVSSGAAHALASPPFTQQFGTGLLNQSLYPGGSPLHRTTSMPAHNTRGLLRTSSLNIKKSAPNRVCCNALLAAYARAVPTQWQRALRLLELMWKCGGELEPDIVSYNTCIKACGNARQVDLGFKIYQLMRSRGIEPTIATFGTLICIAADIGASNLVKEAWGWLQASGLEVHVTAANAYLSALIKDGDWNDTLKLFSSMLNPNGPCRPNAVTFSVMSAAYLARDEPGAIKHLYHQMLCVGVQPSSSTLGQLVCVLAGKELWEDTITLLAAMCRQDQGGRPSLSVFTSVFVSMRDAARRIRAGGAAGRSDATPETSGGGEQQEGMTPEQPSPDGIDAGGYAMQRCLLAQRAIEARQLLKSCQVSSSPDVSLYRAMVGAFAALGESEVCLELFNSMVSAGVTIDPDVSAAILGVVCDEAKWDKVVQLVYMLMSPTWSNPAVPSTTIISVLNIMEQSTAWLPAYQVIKTVRTAGGAHWSNLVEALRTTSASPAGGNEMLLMVLLAEKEASGQWEGAMNLIDWAKTQPTSAAVTAGNKAGGFAASPEAICILSEILYVHGGAEGLVKAVNMVRQAHEQGVLGSYSLPTCLTAATATAAATAAGGSGRSVAGGDAIINASEKEGSGSAQQIDISQQQQGGDLEQGSWCILAGSSAVHALVTLLAWLATLADAYRKHGHMLSSPVADVLVHVPFTDTEAAEALLLGADVWSSLKLPQVNAGGGGGGGGVSALAQFRRIVSIVLEGTYLSLVSGTHIDGSPDASSLTPEQKDMFVIRPPGVLYFPDVGNPALIHINTQGLYERFRATRDA